MSETVDNATKIALVSVSHATLSTTCWRWQSFLFYFHLFMRVYLNRELKYHELGFSAVILPRDAMQARPMPSCGVCLCVRHVRTFCQNE